MEYTSLPQALEALEKLQSTLFAYNHAMGILSQDASTAAPEGSWEARGKTMEVLTRVCYDLTADPRNGILYDYLSAHASQLTPIQARELEVLKKNYDRMRRIPAREYVDYSVLLNEADAVWHRAKPANDFAAFAPYLEKIVAYCRKFAGYYNPDMAPYDALLNEYEEGMNQETLDVFFARLRSAIVPLVEKIGKKVQIDDSFLMKHYPIEQQRHFSDYLMEVMGIDRTYCAIAETEHPFTNNFGSHDVRITTHYYEDNLVSSMYSVIHEGGHALYELGADPCYNFTMLDAQADDVDLQFYYPDPTNYFIDAMCIPSCCENKELAEVFINFMLSQETAVANAEYIYYASPNSLVYNDETYQEDMGEEAMEILYPEGVNFSEEYNKLAYRNLDDEMLSYMNSLWENLKIN